MDMHVGFILILSMIISCAGPHIDRDPSSTENSGWQDFVWKNFIVKVGIEKFYPDPDYLGPWQKDTDVVMSSPLPLSQVREKPFACKEKKLFPTHPSQATKEYLHAMYSQYDHGKLPPSSYACLTKNPTGRFCLRAAIAKLVVMSDIYHDDCGNYYRGYWLTTYLHSDESMGTLYSKGRTAYVKPDAQFPGEFTEDATYPVEAEAFMFLAEILEGDADKLSTERTRALKNGFILRGNLFVRKNPDKK